MSSIKFKVPTLACYEVGIAYDGKNIKGKAGKNNSKSNARKCQRHCKRNRRCKYWTFNGGNKWCYLKTRKGRKSDHGEESKYISGHKNCEPPSIAATG